MQKFERSLHSRQFVPTSFILGMCLLLISASGLAQDQHEDGYYARKEEHHSAYEEGTATAYFGIRAGFLTLENVDDDGSFNWGFYGGYFFNPHLALEGSVDLHRSNILLAAGDWDVYEPLLQRQTTAFQVGLKLMPIKNGDFRPFLTAGLGHYFSEYVNRDANFEYDDASINENGYYAGGGLDLFSGGSDTQGFSVTWDTRWLFTQKEDYHEGQVRADGWVSTIGCAFKF